MHEDFSFSSEKRPLIKENETPEHWVRVLHSVSATISQEDGWSEDEQKRSRTQRLCTAVLREKPFWNKNLQISGEFLRTLEAAIVGAQIYNEYDNSPFERLVRGVFSKSKDDEALNPLLRRKILSILDVRLTPAERETLGREHSLQWERYFPPGAPCATIIPIAPNRIGIFDAMHRMTGIMNPKEKDILPLSADPTLARADLANDIAFTFDITMRKQLSKDFGFPLEQLTLREQISLIGTLRDITATEEQRIIATVRLFGLDGARAFLATEFGDDFRGTVLSIAEKFPEEDAKQIFRSFSEIVIFAQETAETLGSRFFTHDKSYNADAVRVELLSRAKDLLLTAESSDASSITAKLERFKSDIVLFASTFKVTQKGQEVKFEDIRGVHLETIRATDLLEEERIAMEHIARNNWNAQRPELTETLIDGMSKALRNPKTQWSLLKKEGTIAAFVRFDEEDEERLHCGSLNVNPNLRSVGIGEAMMDATIKDAAKNHVLIAEALPEATVTTRYIEDTGFIINGVTNVPIENGKTVVLMTMVLDRTTRGLYKGDIRQAEKFDISGGTTLLVQRIAEETSKQRVVTRFLGDPVTPSLRYIVFEPEITLHHEQRIAA